MRSVLCLGFLLTILVSTSVAGHAQCAHINVQSNHYQQDTTVPKESKIIGQRGNVNNPDLDIVEVSFELKGDSLITRYTIAGTFRSGAYFLENFYDTADQEFSNRKYFIMFGNFKDTGVAAIFNNVGTNENKNLFLHFDGPTAVISGLTVGDIGNKYIIYVSAWSFSSSSMDFVDLEPLAPSGQAGDQLNYHATIALPVDVSFTLKSGADIYIDNEAINVPLGTLQTKLLAGSHTLEARTLISGGKGERDIFKQWNDGSEEAKRRVSVDKPSAYSVTYQKQYLIDLTSPRGETKGSGWYDSGSTASIMLSETSFPADGWLGALGGKIVFDHWSGDFISREIPANVKMDSPKTVQAVFREDYTQPIVVIAVLLACCMISGLALRQLRTKRRSAESSREVETPPIAYVPAKPVPKSPLVLEHRRLANTLDLTKQKLTKLNDAYSAGKATEESYNTLRNDYDKQISKLEQLIKEFESK
ncbi:hypothetical protein MUP59_05110, partial [Candidatus Bathyarchaeota archaeon]|nr:hypothetical protein [Candidatus Bathyarchaeota archaeon]